MRDRPRRRRRRVGAGFWLEAEFTHFCVSAAAGTARPAAVSVFACHRIARAIPLPHNALREAGGAGRWMQHTVGIFIIDVFLLWKFEILCAFSSFKNYSIFWHC